MPAKGVNEHFQQVCVEDKVNKKRNKFYNKCVYFPAQDALCPKPTAEAIKATINGIDGLIFVISASIFSMCFTSR